MRRGKQAVGREGGVNRILAEGRGKQVVEAGEGQTAW